MEAAEKAKHQTQTQFAVDCVYQTDDPQHTTLSLYVTKAITLKLAQN